jgi:hypothetical protein
MQQSVEPLQNQRTGSARRLSEDPETKNRAFFSVTLTRGQKLDHISLGMTGQNVK